ncbi:hypothetical protein Hanom_Chr03g00197361 [Helianthus anomalus]
MLFFIRTILGICIQFCMSCPLCLNLGTDFIRTLRPTTVLMYVLNYVISVQELVCGYIIPHPSEA